jgi:hypothetical protein
MWRLYLAALALACCGLIGAQEQAPETEAAPDVEFLEYLGAWAGSDDEWLAIEEWEKDDTEPRGDVEGLENERDDDDETH